MSLIAVVAAALVVMVASYQRYQDLIPNGRNVTGVCGETDARLCLGSELVPGCGKLNPFGKDFVQENRSWSKALCEMDSDGDGQTNGEELGDPDCQWTAGSGTAQLSPPSGHPGYSTRDCKGECPSTNSTQDEQAGEQDNGQVPAGRR